MNARTLSFLILMSFFCTSNLLFINSAKASQSKLEYVNSFWVHCYTGSKSNPKAKRTYIGSEEISDIGGEIMSQEDLLLNKIIIPSKIESKKVFSLTTKLMLNTNEINIQEHKIDPAHAKTMLFVDLFNKANRIAQTCIKIASSGRQTYLVTDIRISKFKATPKAATMPLVIPFYQKGFTC